MQQNPFPAYHQEVGGCVQEGKWISKITTVSDSPTVAMSQANIDQVIARKDHRKTVKQFVTEVVISAWSISQILHTELGMSVVSVRIGRKEKCQQ